MHDSILQAHQWAPCFFCISGAFSPISIRDQMFRAQSIIDRAVTQKIIGRDRPLLVVGAGAAGVTAAIHAAFTRDVRTLLVEREALAFHLQGTSKSRWLDPYLYDFPLSHWENDDYPLPASVSVPLPWKAGFSSRVAQIWEMQFRQLHGPLPSHASGQWSQLTFSFPDKIEYQKLPYPGAGFREVLTHRMRLNHLQPRYFGMILDCVGFPPEKRTAGMFTGRAFWDNDSLLLPGLGIDPQQRIGAQPVVVISGGGDGALQDVLRAATGAVSARHILDYLKRHSLEIPAEIRRALSDAEDQANRAYAWSTPEWQRDHEVLQKLQVQFEDQVRDYIAKHTPTRVTQALTDLIQSRTPVPLVHFIHCCNHFSQSYGINRFLVLLLSRLLPDVVNWRKNSAIQSVQSVDPSAHICNLSHPDTCLDHPHKVFVQDNPECLFQPGRPHNGKPIDADLVIVRHGPDYSSIARNPLPRPRHLLPYYMAWPQ